MLIWFLSIPQKKKERREMKKIEINGVKHYMTYAYRNPSIFYISLFELQKNSASFKCINAQSLWYMRCVSDCFLFIRACWQTIYDIEIWNSSASLWKLLIFFVFVCVGGVGVRQSCRIEMYRDIWTLNRKLFLKCKPEIVV